MHQIPNLGQKLLGKLGKKTEKLGQNRQTQNLGVYPNFPFDDFSWVGDPPHGESSRLGPDEWNALVVL